MAQHRDNKSKKQLEVRTSVSGHHNTASEPMNNASNISPAELYIIQQAQMVLDQNTPRSGASPVSNGTSSVRHAKSMSEWREKQANDIYKHEPYRYKYGTSPPSSTTFRRTSGQTDSYDTDRAKKK